MNCYYCQSQLIDDDCLNCPVLVKHYYSGNKVLEVVELLDGKYAVDIYLSRPDSKWYKGKRCYIVNTETHYNNIELEENPGITPHNIKEKLKLLLTFQ